MNYVVDCSFTSALFLPDESSGIVRRFFLHLHKTDIVCAPFLWWYETNNVLNIALKRKRLNHSEVGTILHLLYHLNIEIDYSIGTELSSEIINLSQIYNLSSYDASYIELAKRRNANLMTFDNDIISSAKKIGIKVN